MRRNELPTGCLDPGEHAAWRLVSLAIGARAVAPCSTLRLLEAE